MRPAKRRANFPGRINARRVAALARVERQIASGVKSNSGIETPLTADDLARLRREADALALRIIPQERADAICSKKTKALGWSAARAAYRSGKLTA